MGVILCLDRYNLQGDESIADLAVDIAAHNRLRGSDAVYAAVALRFGTELITLDREQLDRLPRVLPVREP